MPNNMNKYRVLINGHNFIINLGNGNARHGFYTSCQVEATNPDDAALKAIETIRRREDINTQLHNKEDDPPLFYVEDIVELKSFDGLNGKVEPGFTWYPEDEKE